MTDHLTALRDRVAGLTSPDREVDDLIWETLDQSFPYYETAERYTASIDAAVALIERAGLLMAGWSVRRVYGGMGDWICSAGVGMHGNEHVADAPTPVLALLLATLDAKIAEAREAG